jgi:hypothetical protein
LPSASQTIAGLFFDRMHTKSLKNCASFQFAVIQIKLSQLKKVVSAYNPLSATLNAAVRMQWGEWSEPKLNLNAKLACHEVRRFRYTTQHPTNMLKGVAIKMFSARVQSCVHGFSVLRFVREIVLNLRGLTAMLNAPTPQQVRVLLTCSSSSN